MKRVMTATAWLIGSCTLPDPEPEQAAPVYEAEAVPDDSGMDSADSGTGTTTPATATWCWTVAPLEGSLALLQVDMAAHTWVEVGRYGANVPSSFQTQSLARLGDHLYTSGLSGAYYEWFDLDLTTGTLTRTPGGQPLSLFTDGTRFFAERTPHGVCEYSSWADVLGGKRTQCVAGFPDATRFTRSDSLVYGAWHTTTEFNVYDAASGVEMETVPLTDWDTWIWGMSVAGGMLHLIDDARTDAYGDLGERIARYDPETGAFIDHTFVNLPSSASGLWCESGSAP